jgi:hypothetical protein
MIVRYFNNQNELDPMSGKAITENTVLANLLDSRRQDQPFLADLCGDNSFQIMIGIGGNASCVQYSRMDNKPPYLMAVSTQPPMKRGYVEFLVNNTLTAIAARYIISFNEMKKIALHFLETGERSNGVSWQSLDPRAIIEDAERPSAS